MELRVLLGFAQQQNITCDIYFNRDILQEHLMLGSFTGLQQITALAAHRTNLTFYSV